MLHQHRNKSYSDLTIPHGMPPTKISAFTRSEGREPSISAFLDLCTFFNVTPDEFLGFAKRRIKLIGEVGAGPPRDYPEPHRLPIDCGALFNTEPEPVAYKVRGRSMVDEGILPDDVVFVRPTPEAEPGSVVLVWLADDDGVSIKRLVAKGHGARRQLLLESRSSDKIKPIHLTEEDKILGVYLGLVRPAK